MKHTESLKPGIYLEITPASGFETIGNVRKEADYNHSYLIYRRPDGTNEVIRGGFNADEPLTKGIKLEIETGKSQKKSKDRLEKGEKDGSRPFKKLNIAPGEWDNKWKKMREAVNREKEAGHIYGHKKTSNSVVRTALDAGGQKFDEVLPKGFSNDQFPGVETNLTKWTKPTQIQDINPIEGEIGGTDDQKPDPSISGAEDKPKYHDISAGADADEDLENASPENRKFMDDLMKSGNPVDEIMLKNTEDLTQGEFVELKKTMINLPAGPEQERLDKAATKFLEHRYGTGPVKYDAVGRMIDPKPVNAIPEKPKPLATADGNPLNDALRRIGHNILKNAKKDGLFAAVKPLQGGINILADNAKAAPHPFPKLKQDGVFGPKTRSGLRGAVKALGTPKVEEGLALGRFNQFARDGRKDGFRGLAEATEKSFAPLFRDSAKPPLRFTDRIEAVTLQETLNDLGGTQFGRDAFKPLKLDGDIGAKTTDSFSQIENALGPEPLTKRFGEFLGFL